MFKQDVGDYAESLLTTTSIDAAFSLLNHEVRQLGFEAALYTYIPRALVHTEGAPTPVFQVSNEYSPAYLLHYEDARFDRHDPLIKAVSDGTTDPIDWSGEVCKSYTHANARSHEVLAVAQDYGIKNGVTLPLLSGRQGIAGASFIMGEKSNFNKLLQERLPRLQLVTKLYSNFVFANAGYLGKFIAPVFSSLNSLEIKFLAGLASGRTQAELAKELSRSEKYLEQVMLKIRRKVSGVSQFDKPTINRNQLMYYAGLVSFIEYADSV